MPNVWSVHSNFQKLSYPDLYNSSSYMNITAIQPPTLPLVWHQENPLQNLGFAKVLTQASSLVPKGTRLLIFSEWSSTTRKSQVYGNISNKHHGQDQGQQKLWPPETNPYTPPYPPPSPFNFLKILSQPVLRKHSKSFEMKSPWHKWSSAKIKTKMLPC